jgi:hypothetical protein
MMRSSATSPKLKISSRGDLRRPAGGLVSDFESLSDGPDAVEAVPRRIASTPSSRRGSDARHARRFGHGTVKMVRQAQSREKLLQKKLEEGLTEKPQRDAEWDFTFPDPGAEPASSYAVVATSLHVCFSILSLWKTSERTLS